MNRLYLINLILLTIILTGCKTNMEDSEIIERYYNGLNQSSFNAVRTQMGSNFEVIEGSDTARYTPESYYQWFQWDSVFKPHYNIMRIVEVNDSLFITLSKSCKRIDFLHDEPLIFTVCPSLNYGKITSIKTVSYQNADWNKWITRRDTLVVSTSREHPELDSFILNQTKDGALTYLKAIEFWLTGDKF